MAFRVSPELGAGERTPPSPTVSTGDIFAIQSSTTSRSTASSGTSDTCSKGTKFGACRFNGGQRLGTDGDHVRSERRFVVLVSMLEIVTLHMLHRRQHAAVMTAIFMHGYIRSVAGWRGILRIQSGISSHSGLL